MIFCPNNLITSTNVTVNGEVTSFPAENMLSDQLVTQTYFEDSVLVDLGVSTSIDTVSYVGEASGDLYLFGSDSLSFDPSTIVGRLNTDLQFVDANYRYYKVLFVSDLAPVAAYTTSGTDQSLTSPNDIYKTTANFCPISTITNNTSFWIGNYTWEIADGSVTVGVNNIYDEGPFSPGSAYGNAAHLFVFGVPWQNFAGAPSNGLQTFYLPQLANGDSLGGSIDYYYHNTYWTYAFNGQQQYVTIAQNGSVYRGLVIQDSALVVRWDGQSGPAGSATPDVLVDIPKPVIITGTGHINHLLIGNKITLPDPRYGSIPKLEDNDISNETISFQEYSTDGTQRNVQSFRFASKSKTEYDLVKALSTSSYRNRAGFFAQTEDNLTLFEPYFAKMKFNFDNRQHTERYNFSASVREVK